METMSREAENRLIDRYINGALTGVERKEFIDRMDHDVEFRSRVVFRNSIVSGIRTASDNKLRQTIVETIAYRKSLVPFGLRLILTFVFIVSLCLLVWDYLGTDSHQVFKFKWFSGKGVEQVKKKSKGERSKEIFLAAKSESSVSDSLSDSLKVAEDVVPISGDSAVFESSDIVVRKDQLLASLSIPVKEIGVRTGASSKENQLTQDAVKRLNPSADLPVEEQEQLSAYQVEFWESPINYRGYKKAGNSIVLYGIMEADDVTLFHCNGKLILRSGQDLFELKPSDVFQPYHILKDPEILTLIK